MIQGLRTPVYAGGIYLVELSTSTSRKTRFDVQLAAGQGNVTKRTWIRVPAIQPLMKSNLQDLQGQLDARVLSQIQARLAQYLGLIDSPD